MPDVLVTDGNTRTALAVIRSLGRYGLSVTAGCTGRIAPSRFSRYATGCIRHPSAARAPHAFSQWLEHHLQRFRYKLIIPVHEETMVRAVRLREQQPDLVPLLTPSLERLGMLRDKYRATRLAQRLGIPCPHTEAPDRTLLIEDLMADCSYPVIVKPRQGSDGYGIAVAYDSRQLRRRVETLQQRNTQVLVQELIPAGCPKYSVAVLCDPSSRIRARFTQVAFRWLGGSTTLSIACHSALCDQLTRWTAELLQRAHWVGVAEVEFLLDPRDGTPRFLEVNPRFWSWLQLAISAGVDFPTLLWEASQNMYPAQVVESTAAIGFRGLLPGDLMVLLGWGHRVPLSPEVRYTHFTSHPLWAVDDPGPALTSALAHPVGIAKGMLFRRHRRR